MNSKQAKALRKAIREQYPNVDKSVFKKLFREETVFFVHTRIFASLCENRNKFQFYLIGT